MFTITVIFWGRWGCWIFPLFNYKGNGRHWKPQMMFARFKNVLSSHTVFRSLFITTRGNQRTVATKQNQQKSSDATSETFAFYSHLLPALDQCLEKTSDLKSFSSRHYQIPYMQSTFSWGKNSPLHEAGLGVLEENCCTWVIFTPREIRDLKTKPKEHRNHDDDLKNAKPVPFVAFFIRIYSPKQTWIQQW